MIRIGLPKGGVKERSLAVIERLIGKNINKNRLSFCNDEYSIFLLKHRDIPKMIEDGILDIGITAIEWLEENRSKVDIWEQLEWCNTRICLIVAKEKKYIKLNKVKCVTEFPNIAKKYFNENEIEGSIYKISGSSEACVRDIFDCCVDCVETGSTLEENDLIIKDVILASKVVLVARENIDRNDIRITKAVNTIINIY